MREGKGGAPFFWAFFSPKKRAGAGDRPEGARPKKTEKYRIFLSNFVILN